MKLTLYMAVLVMLFSSCKKESYIIPNPPFPPPQATLEAKIYPNVIEPREATLGDPSSIFSIGERITVYVEYQAINEQVGTATLSLVDEMGDVLDWVDMSYSNNPGTSGFYPPDQEGHGFFFATIDLNDQYVGKTLTLRTQVNGSSLVASDELVNAFSVTD